MNRKAYIISMLIYTGISLAMALAFIGVAKGLGGYPQVAVYGGAGWVFLLSMIVTMPLVTARIKNRYSKARGE